jgi:hypothetical protein
MSQITGNPAANIGGLSLGLGGLVAGIPQGSLVILWSSGDPNTLGAQKSIQQAAIGSVYLRLDGGTSTSLYVKESFAVGAAGVWVGK